jgi:hypothetical protein
MTCRTSPANPRFLPSRRNCLKGVVYGRNVYQRIPPKKIVAALMEMIHQGASADEVGQRHRLY